MRFMEYLRGRDVLSTKKEKNMENSCENCVFEYTCDWSAAGDNEICDDWKADLNYKKVRGIYESN